ncbi:VC0807 family protein [Streptomyces catenulae]|uniref:VC0807 family protein n=1 Tax=Streptomyces catenulae TaxID=66875 RepID=A0ABV2Z2C1_9ACTN|nr:VC0807 family protein [Streptomyces catenulae]
MTGGAGGGATARTGGALSRTLLRHAGLPLALFYGLRWMGASPFTALLAGAVIPVVVAVRGAVAERRVGGLPLFLLGTMGLTVAVSYVTGSPRLLLIRNGWGMAALGGWMLCTLLFRRPFLYEALRLVVDEERQRTLAESWERHPAFRRMLWWCSALWGIACLVDSAVRVALAMTLPIDVVPVLDEVLLAVTLVTLFAVQRLFGRAYLRRNGLRREGVAVLPLAVPGRTG